MKRYLLFYVFLLVFVLCSWASVLAETSNTEKLGGIEVLPEQVCTSGSAKKEAISVVFMGESIVVPTLYPNVPDPYVPILADLYLYGELQNRYAILNRAGEVTQEIQHEYDAVGETIRQRGYVLYPNGGFAGTSGYALVDLDDDGCPELLLLKNNSSSGQNPSICSVFTIRDEKLTYLEMDSYELQHATILSADGMFYRCIDWQGSGYVNISAFRLEAGMLEFTIVSEASSALSFNDSEVPEPYWVKHENGQETRITEDEFYLLLEQYSQPKELMKLDFVPLYLGMIDPYSSPRHDEVALITSIEYPPSYQGAPIEYHLILDDFYLLSEYIRREEPLDSALEKIGFMEDPRGEKLAYAVIDLNNDGIPELLLGTVEGLKNATPNSIFTLKDGKPVLLRSFWSRSSGVISADGTIYYVGSGGAAYTFLSSFRLEQNADTLTQLTDIHSDFSDSEGKSYFVQVVDARNHYITERSFWEFHEKYSDPAETMELTIITIAN